MSVARILQIRADAYLQAILTREAVHSGLNSPARRMQIVLQPAIQSWAGRFLLGMYPSGSFAKGTANHSGTDIDFFISLSEHTPETLKEVYESLFAWMQSLGYAPRRQNVSINIQLPGLSIDLVPAKRQHAGGQDHSLYRRRADAWTKTNVQTQIAFVRASGRTQEARILKLWRDQKGLEFPSFYIELSVILALLGRQGSISDNVLAAFRYLRDVFPGRRVLDPANGNNIISDDLSAAERARVKNAAERALAATNWNQIVK